jgi:hypothetical protein
MEFGLKIASFQVKLRLDIMRENGRIMPAMETGSTAFWMAATTEDNGEITKNMDKVSILTAMGIFMKGSSHADLSKERAHTSMPQETTMWESINSTLSMAMDDSALSMVINITVFGSVMSSVEGEDICSINLNHFLGNLNMENSFPNKKF